MLNMNLVKTKVVKRQSQYLQEQSFADVLQNRYFEKFLRCHRETPALERFFLKNAGLRDCNTGYHETFHEIRKKILPVESES